jgi:CheY-like chemotaxis protein
MSKILIADDELTARKILTHAVEGMGHIAIQASDGKRALQLLRDNPDIKLLITDILMPEMDGKELTHIIRNDDTLKELPIILISGMITLKEISHILKLGVSRFMPKPIILEELSAYIQQLVKS